MRFESIALLSLALTMGGSDAFIPVSNVVQRTRASSPPLFSATPKEEEKTLRREIAEKASVVEDEAKYSLRDGEGMQGVFVSDDQQTSSASKESFEAKMERIMKPRAYPLFLAEKAAEILEHTVDDIFKDTPSFEPTNGLKEKIVVLGTGWGAASFLKDVDTNKYDVTVISPRNYFLFTPMLAGASVGTVEYRSITEPIREINRKVNFLEATATSIDPETSSVSCESVVCDGTSCDIEEFTVNYDRIIVTIGAQTNTFGIPGVREHCCFLKQIEDARRVRTSIVNCFERSNLPGLTDEARRNNLTFAVIGAGPTGVEFASELRDFIEQDGPKYYPQLLKYVSIKVIEASNTILAPFDESLQKEAIKQLRRTISISDPEVRNQIPENFQLTTLMLESSVKEVKANVIELNDDTSVPYGLAVWAAGNGPLPLTLSLIDSLGDAQGKEQDVARGRVAIDPWCRALGSNGKILALGDCTCIMRGQLPATAQVASQQGEYLASLLNKKYEFSPALTADGVFPPPEKDPSQSSSLSESIATFASQSDGYAKPFQFLNLGILAYTGGGSALAQVSVAPDLDSIKGKGQLGNAVWRSVYLTKQVSWRNRLLVVNDWAKRSLFGRDITQL
eukprot:CAMPEP_0119008070 /NCGR_PEP_ID=MMETSP1176-20130426/3443_1 /TAXON_ID=265551 /ORGANISM="Synedropsis recta cf, Strain CCMP1620" /LENGTH=620 /DNA_ID=CAMNT_0006960335 /DNA_START=53 /DNA_END=1915 /DNA_ORIENTATION=-